MQFMEHFVEAAFHCQWLMFELSLSTCLPLSNSSTLVSFLRRASGTRRRLLTQTSPVAHSEGPQAQTQTVNICFCLLEEETRVEGEQQAFSILFCFAVAARLLL